VVFPSILPYHGYTYNVPDECGDAMNQKLVEGLLLRLHNLSRLQQPTQLIYFCVDFGSIQNTNKTL